MTEAALAFADAPHVPQIILQLLAKLGTACREANDSAGLPTARRTQAALLDDAVGTLLVLFSQSRLLDLARLTEPTDRKLLTIEPERLEQMFGKHELHHLPALPPLTSSPCLYDERLLQEPCLLTEFSQPGILLEIVNNDFRGLLSKTSAARSGEPLENINLNLDRPGDDCAKISQAVQAFTIRRIQQRLEQAIEVPLLPQTAQKIIKLRIDPNVGIDDIIGPVEADPALTVQMVSWVTSPYYAMPGKIHSMEGAIVRILGSDLVISLVLGFALGRSLSLPKDRPQRAMPYWQQAVYTTAVIKGLTRAMPRELRLESGLSYLGGPLHNFGYLVLAHVFPPCFSLIYRHLEVNPHLGHVHIEQHLLGIAREQIDVWLTHVWDMPNDLYCALCFQQDPSYTGPDAVYANLTCLTNRLLCNSGIGGGPQQAVSATSYERLGITPEKTGDAVKKMLETRATLRELVTQFNHSSG